MPLLKNIQLVLTELLNSPQSDYQGINADSRYLAFSPVVAELKAPRMSPYSTQYLKVFEQVCSSPHLPSAGNGTDG